MEEVAKGEVNAGYEDTEGGEGGEEAAARCRDCLMENCNGAATIYKVGRQQSW